MWLLWNIFPVFLKFGQLYLCRLAECISPRLTSIFLWLSENSCNCRENVQCHLFSVTFVESPWLRCAELPYKATYKKSLGKEASPRKCSHHSAAVCGQEKENTDKTKQPRVQEAITLALGIGYFLFMGAYVCVWLEILVSSCVLYSDICVYIVYGV